MYYVYWVNCVTCVRSQLCGMEQWGICGYVGGLPNRTRGQKVSYGYAVAVTDRGVPPPNTVATDPEAHPAFESILIHDRCN